MYSGDTTEYMMFRGTGKIRPLIVVPKTMPRCLSSGAVFFSAFLFRNIFLFFNKKFCDLDRICCSAFTNLIAAAPEVDAVLVNEVAADPSYIDYILV